MERGGQPFPGIPEMLPLQVSVAAYDNRVYNSGIDRVRGKGSSMTRVDAPDVGFIWSQAYEESVKLSVPEKSGFLLRTVGPRLTAASLGLADARQVKRWAHDEESIEPREQIVAARLDALYWIVRAVGLAYSEPVAARFIRSSNPQLHDDAPLSMLADAADERAITRVVAATRAFIEG
jgi:hypothetical protein